MTGAALLTVHSTRTVAVAIVVVCCGCVAVVAVVVGGIVIVGAMLNPHHVTYPIESDVVELLSQLSSLIDVLLSLLCVGFG